MSSQGESEFQRLVLLLEESRRREQETQRLLEEARLREQEAERLLGEEQHRRETAEANTNPQTLLDFLKSCHTLFHKINIVTDKSSTTQGNTTDPAGRPYPLRIVPWTDFLTEQAEIWEIFSNHADLFSSEVFPSLHQLDYVRGNLRPISSEIDIREYARETLEIPVRTVIQEVYSHQQLQDPLNLHGTVEFQSHTNLGEPTLEANMTDLHISDPSTTRRTRSRVRDLSRGTKKRKDRASASKTSSQSVGRRRGGQADQFCIYESEGRKTTIVSIELKAPHKFSRDNTIAGLDGEIRPAEHIINQDGKSFDFLSRTLTAAVITQAFSDMVRKGVRWAYVYTGEAIIFLSIPGHPSIVYYHLSIPALDTQGVVEDMLHMTAVAQVTTFILRAIGTREPSQSWRDEVEKLPIWPVERVDILKDIPPTPLKSDSEELSPNAYESKYVGASRHSPINLRRRKPGCNPAAEVYNLDQYDDNDESGPASPLYRYSTRLNVREKLGVLLKPRDRSGRVGNDDNTKKKTSLQQTSTRLDIRLRSYCSPRCLLGLVKRRMIDPHCPNVQDHGVKHISLRKFISLIQQQLAIDRGDDADCCQLNIKGLRGALFKVRLSSHGYTMVAKAMERHNIGYLKQEQSIYDHVRQLQGDTVPVCLGSVNLELPYYYDSGQYVSMMFLSWAGRSLSEYLSQENVVSFMENAKAALSKLHKLGVLHKDAKRRNMVYDNDSQHLTLVDLERAEIIVRKPLGRVSANRNIKRSAEFSTEIQDAMDDIAGFVTAQNSTLSKLDVSKLPHFRQRRIDAASTCALSVKVEH